MEHAAAQQPPPQPTPQPTPQRIIKVLAPPTHPDGLYDEIYRIPGLYQWSMPRLPRFAGRAAALLWEMALVRLSGADESGQSDSHLMDGAIYKLREVRADPAAEFGELFDALYFASLTSLEAGRVPQARRLWREALNLVTSLESSPTDRSPESAAMNQLSLLAIRLQLDQPGWPLWGPVVPRNPRPARPVRLPRRMRSYLFRYAPWLKPSLLLNSMWGRLLASVEEDPQSTAAIAGFIHSFVIAILEDCWDPSSAYHIERELTVWREVRDSFPAAGPYTGRWTRSEGGAEEDDQDLVPSFERYGAGSWIAPHR